MIKYDVNSFSLGGIRLDIRTERNKEKTVITLTGRLDAVTAPELEKAVNDALEGTAELVFGFEGLDYISSAGLRVLLAAQKIMEKKGCMRVKGVSGPVMDVFRATGFSEILTID
jgi:anti-sigma B factor antagonist